MSASGQPGGLGTPEHAEHAIRWFVAWARAGRFALQAAAAALSRETYTAATREVAVRQIYFTAWQPLIGFTLFTALLSLLVVQITVSAARSYGLSEYALELVFRVLILELLPFGTALLVALRSGAALSTEVALMHASGELEAMRRENVDPFKREFVPRVVAAAVSVASLTVITCAIAMGLAYIAMYGFSPFGFDEFTREVGVVFNLPSLAGFILKSVAFGVAVAIIPISAGIDANANLKSAPVAVMGGMVRLVLFLALLEILSLAVKYV